MNMSGADSIVDPRPLLRIAHSPDPDDAFMWWPLQAGPDGPSAIDTGRFRYEAVLDDIESLNQRSHGGELELTALSCAQYPHVCDRYAITACGASLGDGYGPKLVARDALDIPGLAALAEAAPGAFVIAVPGERTSAHGITPSRACDRTRRRAAVGRNASCVERDGAEAVTPSDRDRSGCPGRGRPGARRLEHRGAGHRSDRPRDRLRSRFHDRTATYWPRTIVH